MNEQEQRKRQKRISTPKQLIMAGIGATAIMGIIIGADEPISKTVIEAPKKEVPKERTWAIEFQDFSRIIAGDIDGKMPIDYLRDPSDNYGFLAKEHEEKLRSRFGDNYSIMDLDIRRTATKIVEAKQYLQTQLQRVRRK